jgi:hypothetical protein
VFIKHRPGVGCFLNSGNFVLSAKAGALMTTAVSASTRKTLLMFLLPGRGRRDAGLLILD